jgi:prepilin-type N-terminal cleavage/methylation domain-containing protein
MRRKSPFMHSQSQHGFTVFELMVATSVFSVILLVMTVGVLRFSHDYFKSVTTSNTQQVARSIANDIAQNIQFGQTVTTGLVGGSGLQGICVGNTLYSYHIGYEVAPAYNSAKHQAPHGLIKTVGSSCSAAAPRDVNSASALASNEHDLLGENMRLSSITVTPGTNNTYAIRVRVLFGDDDLLLPAVTGSTTNWDAEACGGAAGSQFCASSEIATTVQQRVAE